MTFLSCQTRLSPIHHTVFSAEEPIGAFCAVVTRVNDDEGVGGRRGEAVAMKALLVTVCIQKSVILKCL